jgi:threonine dehydrogenase-like Zn-dependent dehydrogenase
VRELTYVARRVVEWREVPDPKLESERDAIVAPVAATSCDVDSAILAGHGPIPPPFAIGHECVARVVEVGDVISHVSPGELVVVPWAISCGGCDRCRAGLPTHCTSVPHMAMFGAPIGGAWGGLFSDLVRVPWADAMLVPLPSGSDPVAMASASDNWSLSYRLVAPHLRDRPGARVLVIARGSIGLYVCDIARALGAPVVQEPTDAIAAVEATSRPAGLRRALRALAPGGVCTAVGYYLATGTRVPLMRMYATDTTLRLGVSHSRAVLPGLLDFVHRTGFPAERVPTRSPSPAIRTSPMSHSGRQRSPMTHSRHRTPAERASQPTS